MNVFYQTTPMTPDQLREAFAQASKQDELVLAVFRARWDPPASDLTPSQVHIIGRTFGSKWLLTSVRRSISSLTDTGVLVKTAQMRMGPHGRPEGCWRLAPDVNGV